MKHRYLANFLLAVALGAASSAPLPAAPRGLPATDYPAAKSEAPLSDEYGLIVCGSTRATVRRSVG